MKDANLTPQVDPSHVDLIVPQIDLGLNWRENLPSGPEESTTPRVIYTVVETTEPEVEQPPSRSRPER